jgi:hypothetical protein
MAENLSLAMSDRAICRDGKEQPRSYIMEMRDDSPIVPALAGADGGALISQESTDAALADAVSVPVEAFAASWPLRSGPFFTSDGQMAARIADAFAGRD